MLLVIDNFDSFTFNLVQYFGQLGVEQKVVRNNELTINDALTLNPKHILISPGPGTPNDSGNSIQMIEAFAGKIPILGVCLGHQCIGQYYGGKIVFSERLMHGKTSSIQHDSVAMFQGMDSPFFATRYHSLLVERSSLPDCLKITAETSEKEIMGFKHREHPIWGVQFHPESFATINGIKILENFLYASIAELQLKNYSSSINYALKAIASGYEKEEIFSILGIAYLKSKQINMAEASFQKGLMIKPSSSLLNYNLALLKEIQSDWKTSAKIYFLAGTLSLDEKSNIRLYKSLKSLKRLSTKNVYAKEYYNKLGVKVSNFLKVN